MSDKDFEAPYFVREQQNIIDGPQPLESDESDDPVLSAMADELRNALEARGLDPTNPPQQSKPPSARVFAEYQKRGGVRYTDADQCTQALVDRVGKHYD